MSDKNRSKSHKKRTTPAKQTPGIHQQSDDRFVERVQQVVAEERFSGPIPPPAMLERYESVQTGLADRLVRMAEEQSAHRQLMERKVVFGNSTREWAGLVLGFAVALAFLGVSAWLINGGHEIAGTVLGSVDIVALVSVFVLGRKEQRDERREKRN